MGTFGCFEVTIGIGGSERLDYLTYNTKGEWRCCYEIKVSKSDFYSKAKLSFVGHFNYFVLTKELFEQVKHDIPSHVGVYVNGSSVKRAKRQELQVSEDVLKDSMIRSLYREFQKQYRSEQEPIVESLERRLRWVQEERDGYRERYNELMRIGQDKYGYRWYAD